MIPILRIDGTIETTETAVATVIGTENPVATAFMDVLANRRLSATSAKGKTVGRGNTQTKNAVAPKTTTKNASTKSKAAKATLKTALNSILLTMKESKTTKAFEAFLLSIDDDAENNPDNDDCYFTSSGISHRP